MLGIIDSDTCDLLKVKNYRDLDIYDLITIWNRKIGSLDPIGES